MRNQSNTVVFTKLVFIIISLLFFVLMLVLTSCESPEAYRPLSAFLRNGETPVMMASAGLLIPVTHLRNGSLPGKIPHHTGTTISLTTDMILT